MMLALALTSSACADCDAIGAPSRNGGASLGLLGLVRSMPADEAAPHAGVGQRLQPTLERLEQRAAVQEDPFLAAAHRALAVFVHELRSHGSRVSTLSPLLLGRWSA